MKDESKVSSQNSQDDSLDVIENEEIDQINQAL
jgi:hypothetical protein